MLQKILAELKNDIATECERLGKTHDPARKAVLRERNEQVLSLCISCSDLLNIATFGEYS